jgi:hypothetical protein
VQLQRVAPVDPVTAVAQTAAARDVRVVRVEDQLGDRVLGHVAQRQAHRRQRPAS